MEHFSEIEPTITCLNLIGVKVEKLEKSIYDVFPESNRRSLDDVVVKID